MNGHINRRYGQWSGNPKGHPEDPERCVAEVYGHSYYTRQCARKRGYGLDGLYCKQHAKWHPAEEEKNGV